MIKVWIRRVLHLGAVCMYCNIGQHCGGCSCCMQRP